MIKKKLTEKERVQNYLKRTCSKIKVIKNNKGEKPLFGIEKLVVLYLLSFRYLSLVNHIRCKFCTTYLGVKKLIEGWAIFKVLTLFTLFFIDLPKVMELIISFYFILDLYSALLNLVLLRQFNSSPISHNRNIILLNINFLEAVLAFALIYLNLNCLEDKSGIVTGVLENIYFSFTTATTVGYGEIISSNKLIPIIQMFSSFLFVGVIFTSFISRSENENHNE